MVQNNIGHQGDIIGTSKLDEVTTQKYLPGQSYINILKWMDDCTLQHIGGDVPHINSPKRVHPGDIYICIAHDTYIHKYIYGVICTRVFRDEEPRNRGMQGYRVRV